MEYLSLVRKDRLVQILQELVSIPSVNPGFPGGCGEAGVASYVESFFREIGLDCHRQHVQPSRDNVIGKLTGSGPLNLLLEAHMDTVQTDGMIVDPFAGLVRDGRLYGRGACDTKASLAMMMHALEVLYQAGLVPPVNVHLAAVVDEEITYKGISAICNEISAERLYYVGAIVGEPTQLDLIIAHKGVLRFHVDVHGTAAHSSNPAAGINAVEKMCEVIAFLKKEEEKYSTKPHPLVGSPTHCISMIQGGVAPNTVPESCRITIDRRTVPGEDSTEVWREMKDRLEQFGRETSGLRLTVKEPFLIDYSLDVSPDEPLVRGLEQSANRYGAPKRIMGAPYATDASKLCRVGVPAVVFGPGHIAQAHTKDEWIEIDEVVTATAVLLETIMNYNPEEVAP